MVPAELPLVTASLADVTMVAKSGIGSNARFVPAWFATSLRFAWNARPELTPPAAIVKESWQ